MVEGREFVPYAIPFTSGIAFSAMAEKALSPASHFIFAVIGTVFAAIGIMLCIIICQSNRCDSNKEENTSRIPILLLLFLCGIECFLLSCMNVDESFGKILESRMISIPGKFLKDSVDGLPYSGKESASLAKALLYGDKSGLSEETIGNFRKSGGAHLLALSGMHLGVIYMLLAKTLRALGKSKTAMMIKAALIILISGFYTLITGASPSLIRAFIFITLNEVCKISGRSATLGEIFHAALMIQLAVVPDMIKSVSFQLSYLAVAGITYIYPRMSGWFIGNGPRDIMKRLWNASAMSISCQITTFPVIWLSFGTFPIFFMITNLIAIPLTTLAMCSTLAVQILYGIGLCADPFIRANETILCSLIACMDIIGGLSSGDF